jgi:enolase
MKVKELKARIIKNSRNEDAIEVIVNKKYTGSAPSGASTGAFEVKAFTKDAKSSVNFLNKLNLQGLEFNEFKDLKKFEDLIPIIGGNPVIALQYAILRGMAENKVYKFFSGKKLPVPLGNVIGGGAHTELKSTEIQEFLLVPEAKTFEERMKLNKFVHKTIGKIFMSRHKTDEGAYILNKNNQQVFEFLYDTLEQMKVCLGVEIRLGADIAATQFWKNGRYHYGRKSISSSEQIKLVNDWIEDFDLAYVEDPLQEGDFLGFSKINRNTLVCGDDLVATDINRLRKALKYKSVNCIIVKPNQIGSVVKAKEMVDFARKNGVKTVISHRSGETMDTMIAHLAVGWNVPYIKTGIFGKEREVKLLELVKIEKEI